MAGEEQAPRLFERKSKPAGFFLHPSIKHKSQRTTLVQNITMHGGKVLDDAHDADTVLIDEKHLTVTRKELQISYSISRDERLRNVVVEPMSFIQVCIRDKEFTHKLPDRHAMGGYVGRKRINFTKEDDDNLCWFLSRTIPNPTEGGRLSTGVYKVLLAMSRLGEEYQWAKRHTVESWRERYRKNQERFDPIIKQYTIRDPPEPPARYGLNRHLNKYPARAFGPTEVANNNIIELTDSSSQESEEDSDVGLTDKSGHLDAGAKHRKRRRIESKDSDFAPSTPSQSIRTHTPPSTGRTRVSRSSRKGKGKEVESGRGIQEPQRESPFARDFLSAGPSQVRWAPRSSQPQEGQADIQHTPPPTATLVHRSSPMLSLPSPSNLHVRQAVPPSPHPSASFRNVAHSSPLFVGPESANRSGAKSHNTSATEPSSHSVIVPPGLAPPGNTNGQAESSITRESSHKRSSPIPLPMRKAARKKPSRQPRVAPASEDDEPGWAPYKNTRSRSRSTEPAPLQVPTKRRRGGTRQLRSEAALDPVHEGEVEHEDNVGVVENIDEQRETAPVALTETIQDEQSVADFLMVHSNDTSRVFVAPEEGIGGSNEETEDEGEGQRATTEKKEEEEEEESGEDEEQNANEPRLIGHLEDKVEDDEDRDEVRRKLSPILRRQVHPKATRPTLESDDDEIDRMIRSFNPSPNETPSKSAQEVLALFGSSPEERPTLRSRPGQRGPLDSYRNQSPGRLRPQNQNQPMQARAFARKVTSATRRVSPPPRSGSAQKSKSRVSFGSPSGRRSLPRTPIPQHPRPQLSSQSQGTRRGSVGSSSSEMNSFPLSGTRASAVKQRIEQELKASPYTPPPGTKAAKIVAANQRQTRRRQ